MHHALPHQLTLLHWETRQKSLIIIIHFVCVCVCVFMYVCQNAFSGPQGQAPQCPFSPYWVAERGGPGGGRRAC